MQPHCVECGVQAPGHAAPLLFSSHEETGTFPRLAVAILPAVARLGVRRPDSRSESAEGVMPTFLANSDFLICPDARYAFSFSMLIYSHNASREVKANVRARRLYLRSAIVEKNSRSAILALQFRSPHANDCPPAATQEPALTRDEGATMKHYLALAALPLIAACAQNPNSIAPVSMGDAYAGISCNQARGAIGPERQTLAALEAKQKSAVTGDALGVFLIGVPVSSLTGGDVAGQIALSKGKLAALEARAASCG